MIKCVPESSAGTHGGPDGLLVFEDTAAVPMVSPQALVGLSRACLQEGCLWDGVPQTPVLSLCTRMDLGNAAVKCRSRDSVQRLPLCAGAAFQDSQSTPAVCRGDEATRVTGDGE